MQTEQNEEDFTGPSQGNNKLIGLLYAAYFLWSKFVVRHRFAIIALCSILSTMGAIKIAKTPFGNNIMGFTPYGARSLAESSIRDQFFNSSEGKGAFGVFLLVKPKKEGQNMLREEMLREVIRIDDLVNWNISLRNAAENKSESFAEFCRDFCNINEPIRLFWQGFQTKQQNEDNFEEEKMELDYPTINVFGRRMNIQPYFHGVKFAPENGTKGQSNMEFVEMIGLIYREQRGNGLLDEDVKEYEMAVTKFLEKEFKSDLVRVLSISTSYVEAEFVRANLSMLPFLGIGLTVMLICTSICIPLSAAYFQQASVHKISLAVVACICPFMATGTALGLLFLCGLRFSPILCATPFLVLAIGVDDAYLMSHAWNRLAKTCNFQRIVPKGGNAKNEKAENEEDEKIVANLLAMVLMDSGPAILISALANISADAIGAFIGSPEITILCVGNATALTFDFLFQCTYFVGVMATIGLIERKEMRKKMEKANEKRGNGNIQQQGIEQGGWQKRFHDSLKTFVTKFVNFYTNSICNPFCAIFVVLCSALFIGFSIFAITKFEVNMSTKQLYSQDSPLLEIENIRENQINPFYTQATVFVNNFGNLSNQSRVAEIDKFVGEFEHLNESWGPQSSMYFLRDLREYLTKREEVNEEQIGQILNGKSANKSKEVEMNDFDCQELMAFLDEAEYAHWRGFVRLGENGANSSSPNSSCPIQRFFFTTAFHDPKLFKWSERVELLRKWRQIVDENEKSIDASVYHEEGIYLDLMDNMPTDTWQSAVATLICMAAICLFLLHDLRTVLVTTTVIAIIIVETMGILSISGVALNQLMMGSLVISIGFSVDLPAHFSYHFLTSDGSEDSSTKSKLKATIRAVGLPSVQASLSTSLCVLSHYWIQLYIAQIFVRIICLTICLCLLNTLVVLPALLFLIGLIGTNLKAK